MPHKANISIYELGFTGWNLVRPAYLSKGHVVNGRTPQPAKLEDDFHRELQDASGTRRRRDLAETRRPDHVTRAGQIRVAGTVQIGTVEQIEELGAEGQPAGLSQERQGEVTEHGEVHIREAGAHQRIPAQGSVSAGSRLSHGAGVEVFSDLRPAAARAGELHRTGYIGVSSARASHGIVRTIDGERAAGLQRDNGARLPVRQDRTRQLRAHGAARVGNLPDQRIHEALAVVEIRGTPEAEEIERIRDCIGGGLEVRRHIVEILREGITELIADAVAVPLAERNLQRVIRLIQTAEQQIDALVLLPGPPRLIGLLVL